jgi:hypothetical protein
MKCIQYFYAKIKKMCAWYVDESGIGAVNLRRMRWLELVAGKRWKILSGFWLENVKGRDHLGDRGIDEKIIIKWNLERI